MRICLLVACLVLSATLFSQNSLEGKVLDNLGRPIALATIQLQQNGKTIQYTNTDAMGHFLMAFTVIPLEGVILKTTHISYQADTFIVKKEDYNKLLTITLLEKKAGLREVIVQSKLGIARSNGDTLSYNLKALTTGNEEKLKDILKKLPGIEINEDGKITSQGKVINDLMINGKKMFGDNHQIATENISAEMVEGVDLLSNYESFGAIKEVEGSNKTGLNVTIKKGYLGKIKGNVDVLGAYDERYKLHSNLFKFTTKLNVAAIANLNNTGYQPLPSKDYFSMNRSVRQDFRNSSVAASSIPSFDDIPAFILSDDNLTAKKSAFASFDINYQPSQNWQINGFSIFNKLNTTENIFSSRLLLDIAQNLSFKENTDRNNRLFFNQSKFNIDYKPSKNILCNYTILFDATYHNAEHYITNNLNDSTNSTVNNQDKLNLSLGHQLSLIRKIAKNKLLSLNIFHELKNQQNDLDLWSNINLFDIGNRYLQANKMRKNDWGVFGKYTQKIGPHIVRGGVGWVAEHANFGSANPTAIDGDADLAVQYAFVDISIQKKTGKWHYQAKVEARPYFLRYSAENKQRFLTLPSLQVKYNFSQTHHLMASYSRTVDFPRIDRLNNFDYAEDFRTYTLQSPVLFNTLLRQDMLSLNYFRFDLYNGIVVLFNSAYTLYGNKISSNTNRKSTYNQVQSIVTAHQFAWNNTFSYEHRLSKLRNKFKIGGSYVQSNFINQINGLENRQNARFYNIKTSLLSNFRASYFNYEIAFSYVFQQTKSSLFNQVNRVIRITPAVNFDGMIAEKWTYRIDNAFEKFRSQDVTTQFYNLGFKLKYKSKKMAYWIETNNLLNLNNPQVIKVSTVNNILSTEIVNRLAGYVGLGVGFEL